MDMTHGGPSRRKLNRNISANDAQIAIPIPPDGGYGWVIVLASFLSLFIIDGITYSFGLIFVELCEEFKESRGFTSTIISVMSGMTSCSGPIASSLVNIYGCRAVTIAGGLVASACLLVSYFGKSVFTLIITIGFGCGFGLGLIYLPAIVSVCKYFKHHRSMAIGIAVTGSGLGSSIFSPLVASFISELGWRNTLLVLSGIVSNCVLLGALFRPLKPTAIEIISNEQIVSGEEENESAQNQQNRVGPSITAISEVGQPMLTDGVFEMRPLNHSRKRSTGTLLPPVIVQQVSLHKQDDIEVFGSFALVDDNKEKIVQNCFVVDGDESCMVITNFGLLGDPIFLVFALSNLCTYLGLYVPYICLMGKAQMHGVSPKNASDLLATISISNILGRIILGFISDHPWINRLPVYSSCLFVCGIATAASVFCSTLETLAFYSAVFGFLIGAFTALTPVILVDLLGLDNFTNAFGLLLLFQGIVSFIGTPIVSVLQDQWNSYTPGFLYAGTMIALSGFMLFFIPSMQKCIATKAKRKEIKNNARPT